VKLVSVHENFQDVVAKTHVSFALAALFFSWWFFAPQDLQILHSSGFIYVSSKRTSISIKGYNQ
tara:strand:- start:927 stop:1118 length:192 start_codon:yes stop_codon:yes gene_type:complete